MAHFITFEYEMSHFPCVQTNVRFEHMQCNTKDAYLASFTCPILFTHFNYQNHFLIDLSISECPLMKRWLKPQVTLGMKEALHCW